MPRVRKKPPKPMAVMVTITQDELALLEACVEELRALVEELRTLVPIVATMKATRPKQQPTTLAEAFGLDQQTT